MQQCYRIVAHRQQYLIHKAAITHVLRPVYFCTTLTRMADALSLAICVLCLNLKTLKAPFVCAEKKFLRTYSLVSFCLCRKCRCLMMIFVKSVAILQTVTIKSLLIKYLAVKMLVRCLFHKISTIYFCDMVCRFLRKNWQQKNVQDGTEKLRMQKTDPHS